MHWVSDFSAVFDHPSTGVWLKYSCANIMDDVVQGTNFINGKNRVYHYDNLLSFRL